MALTELLLANLAPAHRESLSNQPGIDPFLLEFLERAKNRWPEFQVSQDEFIPHMARSLRDDLPLYKAFSRLRVEELYLAFACACGDERAASILVSDYIKPATAALNRIKLTPDQREEILQTVNKKILVAEGDRPLGILSFQAWAPLKSWLRAIVLNTALNHVRASHRDVLSDALEYIEVPATSDDPELENFKQLYKDEFRSAFRKAILLLDSHQRNLLRLHYLGGMNIDKLAAIYQIHRATAARRLQKIRSLLLEHTRSILGKHLGLDDQRIDSVIGMVLSKIDISLHTDLRTLDPMDE